MTLSAAMDLAKSKANETRHTYAVRNPMDRPDGYYTQPLSDVPLEFRDNKYVGPGAVVCWFHPDKKDSE